MKMPDFEGMLYGTTPGAALDVAQAKGCGTVFALSR
jgi:hypothetical protein